MNGRASIGAACVVVLLSGCGGGGGQAAAGPADPTMATSDAPDARPDDPPDTPPGNRPGGTDGGHGDARGGDSGPPSSPVPDVLDFSATQISGEDFDARELAGTDTVFWFWAPWCTECAAAAPQVQAAAEANPDVRFVGVAGLSSDVSSMQTFVADHGLTFPQLADADGAVYTRFGITQQDTYVLVSASGDVETVDAYSDDADAQELVDQAFG